MKKFEMEDPNKINLNNRYEKQALLGTSTKEKIQTK